MTQNIAEKVITLREETRETADALYTYKLFAKSGANAGDYGLPLYSIELNMTDKFGNHTEAKLEDIFSDSSKAFKFFSKLVEHLATPINLPYIVEDDIR